MDAHAFEIERTGRSIDSCSDVDQLRLACLQLVDLLERQREWLLLQFPQAEIFPPSAVEVKRPKWPPAA